MVLYQSPWDVVIITVSPPAPADVNAKMTKPTIGPNPSGNTAGQNQTAQRPIAVAVIPMTKGTTNWRMGANIWLGLCNLLPACFYPGGGVAGVDHGFGVFDDQVVVVLRVVGGDEDEVVFL